MTKRGIPLLILAIAVALPTWDHAAEADCSPRNIPRALIAVTPDTGQVTPDFLVIEGRLVTLHGVAERFTLSTDCSTSVAPLPFRWSLRHRTPGGLLTDVTQKLTLADQLSPQFTAERGTYVVTLETVGAQADSRSATAIVEVVRRGGGWVSIGPDGRNFTTSAAVPNLPGVPVSWAGRINTIAIHPNTPNVMYAGAARGGVWRSDNGGADWWPMSDHKGLPPGLSIGRLAISPSGRVFASVPDTEGGVRHGARGPALFWSSNDGVTWNEVGDDPNCVPSSIGPSGKVTRILVDPTGPDTVFASTSTGVFRTTDAGRCWESLLASTDVVDMTLVQQVVGQTILYAATAGPTTIGAAIIRTLDANAEAGKVTWESTPEPRRNLPNGTTINSIPALASPVARIALASSKNVVYAIVAQGPSAPSGHLRVFRTTTSDEWVEKTEPLTAASSNSCDGQCDYNLAISASRVSEDDIVVGTVTVFRSTDGGGSWSELNPSSSSLWDHHTIVHHPTDPDLVFSGSDAGIQRIRLSLLGTAGGIWRYTNSGLNNLLFEGLGLSNSGRPWKSIGGVQDRGTLLQVSGRYWTYVGGADGQRAEFDGGGSYPVFFTSAVTVSWAFQRKGGTTPMGLGEAAAFWADPERSGVLIGSGPIIPLGQQPPTLTGLYYASDLTTGTQVNWQCIDPLPATPGTFSGAIAFISGGGKYLVGSTAGNVFITNAPTTPASRSIACTARSRVRSSRLWSAPATPAGQPSSVTGLAIPNKPSLTVFYAVLFRYDESRVVEVRRTVVPTGDGGVKVSWRETPIAGVPGQADSFPSNNDSCCPAQFGFVSPIAVDPDNAGILYVGTENGLVVGRAQPDGTWKWALDEDVPETWVNDVQVRAGAAGRKGVVRISTFGRGVFERVQDMRVPTLAGSQVADVRKAGAEQAERSASDRNTSELSLAVDYAYDGAHGRSVSLRARPSGETGSRFFSGSAVSVRPGTGTAVLSLVYAGDGTPLDITTHGFILEMVDPKGRVFVRREIGLPHRWKPIGAHRITVTSEAFFGEGAPAPIAMKFRSLIEGKGSALDAPTSLVAADKTRVVISVPATVPIPGSSAGAGRAEARFVGWRGIGGPRGSNPELTLDVVDDLDLTAVYAVRK